MLSDGVVHIAITTSDQHSIKKALQLTTPAELRIWIFSIDDQLRILEDNRTWWNEGTAECRSLPPTSTHAILKIKRNADRQPVLFKDHVVAGGHLRVLGVDLEYFYEPLIYLILLRVFVALALQH